MVLVWEPDTDYAAGDVVEFEGRQYRVVQPHRSQADWTPPIVPALFARVPEQYTGGDQQGLPQQSYGGNNDNNDNKEKNWDEHEHQQVDIPPQEQEKHWYDLDDKRKRELEIGGGLAAGLALVAGGYAAYRHHEKKSEEEKKAQVWGVQTWLKEAQARTEEYHRNGPRSPVTWILVHGKQIPQYAIQGGEENGQPLFISRAFHEGSVQVGKAGAHLQEGASIGYGHEEITLGTYEILVGDQRAVRWVEDHGHLNPEKLGARPVEGGRDGDGTPLYIAQAHIEGSVQPGKCSTRLDGAFIPWGGTEKHAADYRVLCYN